MDAEGGEEQRAPGGALRRNGPGAGGGQVAGLQLQFALHGLAQAQIQFVQALVVFFQPLARMFELATQPIEPLLLALDQIADPFFQPVFVAFQ